MSARGELIDMSAEALDRLRWEMDEGRIPADGSASRKCMSRARKLPRSFYQRDDVVTIARDLLGKVLCTRFNGTLTSRRHHGNRSLRG